MSSYGVFLQDITKVEPYRLPVNPEEITVKKGLATETYKVLGLEQIIVPTGVDLCVYNFECEIPSKTYLYVENVYPDFKSLLSTKIKELFRKGLYGCDFFEELFRQWAKDKTVLRLTINNGVGKAISTPCLIKSLEITETAGEEGDKLFKFEITEYAEYGYKKVVKKKTKKKTSNKKNTKAKTTYTVKTGDTLYLIAKKIYGDGAKASKIQNANKDKIKNPAKLKKGIKLVIP